MSKTDVDYGLDHMLKSKDKVFVLFYASWCPFSQEFLPMFEKFAEGKTQSCTRVKTDDKASLCEEYSIDVVPTVIFFKNGKIAKRLDGMPGVGLDEKQLMDFTSKC
jgi:thioredoxin 1